MATFLTAGIDSNYGLPGRYEYLITFQPVAGRDDFVVIARATGFKSKAAAKRAGLKAYEDMPS